MVVRRGGTEQLIDTETFFYLECGDEIEIHETGGGGYGDPRERDRSRVDADVADGLVSPEQAREVYGLSQAGRAGGR